MTPSPRASWTRLALTLGLALAAAGCGLAPRGATVAPSGAGLAAKSLRGAWIPFPEAPVARARAAGAAIGFTLHLVGGEDGGALKDHDTFTAFDRWGGEAELPFEASGAAMAFVPAERLVLAGGEVQGQASARAALWTPGKGWEAVAPMPTARQDAGVAGRGVFAYVAGGTGADGRPTAALEVFDVRDRSWKALAPLPVATTGGVMAKTGERLTYAGGRTASGLTDATWIYDFETNAWAAGPALPTAREGAAVATYGALMYVVGGRGAAGPSAKIERFRLGQGWTAEADLPVALEGAVAAKLGERLVVTGGRMANGQASRKTWGLPFNLIP